jgi:glycosyltransferase involved in cell wall biosynthesis
VAALTGARPASAAAPRADAAPQDGGPAPASTLVLIPACNEAGRIGEVIEGIRATGVAADVVVIDDGSRDATAQEARAHGAKVLSHAYNLGYGSALHTGYLYARRRGYQRLVQMDGDGQHDADSMVRLLAALEAGADVVVGSRFLDGRPPPTSWTRRVGSALFAWIVTRWTGIRITDPTSGYQAMSQRAIREVARDTFPEDYPDADVLIMLAREGLQLVEVPARMHPRKGGVSMHRGGRAAYYAYKMLLTLSLLPIRRKSLTREA